MAVLVGCDGPASNRTAAADDGGSPAAGATSISSAGGSSCPAGSETCACYGNRTCNDGLVCASNLCVSLGNGGTTGSGGTPSAGSPGSNAGAPALGGSPNSGGNVSASGAVASTLGGGATIAGSGQFAGGMSNGGTGALAGSWANGGVLNTGSTNAVAGMPTGGNPAAGGGTSLGGSLASGGGVPIGGQSTTGGSSVTQLCGNGIVEGSETCDSLPLNNDLGDGCTPNCMAEPLCPAGGGACISKCGDGLVFDHEACDDGNAADGDGCSADCKVEPGFACEQPPLGDSMAVPMVVRDFNMGGDFEKGSTFATGLNYATQGLLSPTLGANGLKPVLASTSGTYNGTAGKDSGIASPASFAQWYDDAATAAGNTYHGTIAATLTLYRKSDGSAYVNRFSPTGEQYVRTSTPGSSYCGDVGREDHDALGNPIPCTSCLYDEDPSTPQCDPAPYTTKCQTDPTWIRCVQNGSQWSGIWVLGAYDGNPLWFPADRVLPYNPVASALIPGYYDPAWPAEPGSPTHNFSFTTEVRFWFKYDSSQTYKLSVLGDDDIWVFINKKLAVDMGGIHTPVNADLSIASGNGAATVTVTPTNITSPAAITTHPDLGGLQHGSVYEVVVFQAERQTKSSSYQLSLIGFNTARSQCHSI